MELILNDFSVVGQFASYDEFADYVIKTLGPVLDLVIENQIPFYKKQNFYDCKITKDMSLNDILMLTGDPVIYKIRSYISQLGYQKPYWDEDIMSQSNVSYTYPEKEDEPNCFTEVIERRGVLFSFPFLKYNSDVFECKREDEDISVQNVREKKSFLNTYLLDDVKNIRYILERYPFEREITLATYEKKCYAEEALLKNDLKMEDMQRIVLAIPRMIEGFARGEKNDYWDSLRDGIYEFRIHVSSNRIFRLLFFQDGGIVFLNGFIKKRQTTPPGEIEKALKIKRFVQEKSGM